MLSGMGYPTSLSIPLDIADGELPPGNLFDCNYDHCMAPILNIIDNMMFEIFCICYHPIASSLPTQNYLSGMFLSAVETLKEGLEVELPRE